MAVGAAEGRGCARATWCAWKVTWGREESGSCIEDDDCCLPGKNPGGGGGRGWKPGWGGMPIMGKPGGGGTGENTGAPRGKPGGGGIGS